MTEEQIKKAVKEAEEFKEEDEKRKRLVETKNHADTLIISIEKVLSESGDKISESDKAELEAEVKNVKAVLSGDDMDAISNAMDGLKKVSDRVFTNFYQNAGGGEVPPEQETVVEDAEEPS